LPIFTHISQFLAEIWHKKNRQNFPKIIDGVPKTVEKKYFNFCVISSHYAVLGFIGGTIQISLLFEDKLYQKSSINNK